MRKVEKDAKTLLFENMVKLNPNFKESISLLNENEEKWIQKAVDPEHKGFCSPMSKPTCTPARKALAQRFKKGIENEGINFNNFDNPEEFKVKAAKIKAQIDNLMQNEDFDIIDTLYRLMVEKKKSTTIPNQVSEDLSNDYRKKADLIKGKIDFLVDTNHADILDKIDGIINQLYPAPNQPEMELNESLYKKNLSESLIKIKDFVSKRGFPK